MKKTLKTLLAMAIVLVMVVAMLPAGALAVGYETIGGAYVNLEYYPGASNLSRCTLNMNVYDPTGALVQTNSTNRQSSAIVTDYVHVVNGEYKIDYITYDGSVKNGTDMNNGMTKAFSTTLTSPGSTHTLNVYLKDNTDALQLYATDGTKMGTITYKKGGLVTKPIRFNYYLNYVYQGTTETVNMTMSVPNNAVIRAVNSNGIYYGVAAKNSDLPSDMTLVGDEITWGVFAQSLNPATVDLYFFTYNNGKNIDFTRYVNLNTLAPDLSTACPSVDVSFTHAGRATSFTYSKFDQAHTMYVPRATNVFVTAAIGDGYNFDLWLTADTILAGANRLYTIRDDGTLSENEVRTLLLDLPLFEGSRSYSNGMAMYFDTDDYDRLEIALFISRDFYTLSYDANGGSGTMSAQRFRLVAPIVKSNAFTKDDCEFVGWNTKADGSGDSFAPGSTWARSASGTLYAQWRKLTHTVTWVNWNGSVLKSGTFTGTAPAASTYDGATPTKPSDGTNSYSFSGWSEGATDAEGNVTYTAQFTAIPLPVYTVRWVNWNGSVLKSGTFTGTAPAANTYDGATPTKPADDDYTYWFSGWSEGATDAEGNVTYTALFDRTAIPKYTVTIRYQYADGTQAAPVYTSDPLAEGKTYSVTSPTIEGYTADKPVVAGTMPAGRVEVTVTYNAIPPETHLLTVNYVYAGGGAAASSYTEHLAKGAPFSVESPAIEYYKADQAAVFGTMGDADVTVTVTYTAIEYTLTVNYVYAGGGEAAPTVTEKHVKGDPYSVTSPVIEHYTASAAAVSGEMPGDNVTVDVTYTAIPKHALTITYVLSSATRAAAPEAPAPYARDYEEGEEYSVESPTVEGYTPDKAVVSGTMGTEPVDVTVTYTKDPPKTHKLTINYVIAVETRAEIPEAPEAYKAEVAEGAEYSVESPEVEGYTPDKAVVSGTMGTEDIEVTVTYTKDPPPKYALTIRYQYASGDKAADEFNGEYAEGEEYSVESPVIEGYTPDKAVVSGTMGTEDIEVTVTYTKDPPPKYALTIRYQYASGDKAADEFNGEYAEGEEYSVESPVIEGYTPDKATVSGTMPGSPLELAVTYTADPGPSDDPTPSPEPTAAPEPSPEPSAEPETGPAPSPEPSAEPTDEPVEETIDEIFDDEIPTYGEAPAEEETLTSEPDEVLYGSVPLTGDKSMPYVWAGLALLAAAGIAVLSLKTRKKEDK